MVLFLVGMLDNPPKSGTRTPSLNRSSSRLPRDRRIEMTDVGVLDRSRKGWTTQTPYKSVVEQSRNYRNKF